MEGIMTGIKPRENFQDKGMSDDMLSSIRGKIDLIDAVSGAGRQDNLSNLLISGGMNMLTGEYEGDNVLQTAAGAYKQPTQQLFASQAKDRSGKRAIAASLISKMGTGGLEKFRGIARDLLKQESYQKKYGTDANAVNKLAGVLFEESRFRKPVSPNEAKYQKDKASIATLSSMKDKIYKSPSLTAPEAELVNEELNKIKKTDSYDIVDIGKIFADKDQDYPSMPSIKIKDQAGKPIELKVYAVTEDEDYYTPGKLYYKISDRSWFKYNADNKSLVQMPGL